MLAQFFCEGRAEPTGLGWFVSPARDGDASAVRVRCGSSGGRAHRSGQGLLTSQAGYGDAVSSFPTDGEGVRAECAGVPRSWLTGYRDKRAQREPISKVAVHIPGQGGFFLTAPKRHSEGRRLGKREQTERKRRTPISSSSVNISAKEPRGDPFLLFTFPSVLGLASGTKPTPSHTDNWPERSTCRGKRCEVTNRQGERKKKKKSWTRERTGYASPPPHSPPDPCRIGQATAGHRLFMTERRRGLSLL